jgi:hypothetical protein
MKHTGKCYYSGKLVNEGDYCSNHSRIENRKCAKTCGYYKDLKDKDKERQTIGRKAFSECVKINPTNPLAVAQNIDRMVNAIKFMADLGSPAYVELLADIKKER